MCDVVVVCASLFPPSQKRSFRVLGNRASNKNARRILQMTSNPAEFSHSHSFASSRGSWNMVSEIGALLCSITACTDDACHTVQHTHTIPLSPPPSSPSHRNRCGPQPVMIPGLILGVAGSSKGICSKGDLRLSRSQQRQPLYIHILRRAAAIHLFGARAACRRPPTQRKVLCSEQPKLSLLPPRNICG